MNYRMTLAPDWPPRLHNTLGDTDCDVALSVGLVLIYVEVWLAPLLETLCNDP